VCTLLASPVWDYVVAMNAVNQIRHPMRTECSFFVNNKLSCIAQLTL